MASRLGIGSQVDQSEDFAITRALPPGQYAQTMKIENVLVTFDEYIMMNYEIQESWAYCWWLAYSRSHNGNCQPLHVYSRHHTRTPVLSTQHVNIYTHFAGLSMNGFTCVYDAVISCDVANERMQPYSRYP